jgi:uncharacterized membrane protein
MGDWGMGDWAEYAAAFAAFFASHAVPVRPPLRPWLVAQLGQRGFTLAYSALSLAVLAWLMGAAGRAPHVPLWNWAPWQAYVPLVAMLPVCLILSFAVARPNPFSFGGTANDSFDPARPGLVRWMRHPLLVALAIWAGAHVVPNGDLAHVLMFGIFLLFALFGQHLINRRRRREMGPQWAALDIRVAASPLRPTPLHWRGAALRIAAGIGLYVVLLGLHPAVIGVSPLP